MNNKLLKLKLNSKTTMMIPFQILDCVNTNSAMTLVKIIKAFQELEVGEKLVVTNNDPLFRMSVESWVRKSGQQLLNFEVGTNQSQAVTLQKVK